MTATVISNIVVAVLALIGTVIGSYAAHSKTTALIAYRIDELEEKVNKHNNLIERTTILERDMKSAWKVIDGLKGDR